MLHADAPEPYGHARATEGTRRAATAGERRMASLMATKLNARAPGVNHPLP
jgi:hypothetical protein